MKLLALLALLVSCGGELADDVDAGSCVPPSDWTDDGGLWTDPSGNVWHCTDAGWRYASSL